LLRQSGPFPWVDGRGDRLSIIADAASPGGKEEIMKCGALTSSVASACLCGATLGDVRFFVDSPTQNSADFVADRAAAGQTAAPLIDFSTHPDGEVVPDWYQTVAGATLSVNGTAAVRTGVGSLDGNTFDPGGIGEGLMPEPMRYLDTGSASPMSVDFAFDPPVTGFGLMTADMFMWVGGNPAATIEAFDADGASLGLAASFDQSFEFDFYYFMGVVDDAGRIARVRFTNFGGSGDTIYVTQGWLSRAQPTVCPADFNGDGFLDFFDYDDYVNCFETGACPEGRTADFNGDGFADFFDYDDFVAAFEAGC
jgi:hypothetical protein